MEFSIGIVVHICSSSDVKELQGLYAFWVCLFLATGASTQLVWGMKNMEQKSSMT